MTHLTIKEGQTWMRGDGAITEIEANDFANKVRFPWRERVSESDSALFFFDVDGNCPACEPLYLLMRDTPDDQGWFQFDKELLFETREMDDVSPMQPAWLVGNWVTVRLKNGAEVGPALSEEIQWLGYNYNTEEDHPELDVVAYRIVKNGPL